MLGKRVVRSHVTRIRARKVKSKCITHVGWSSFILLIFSFLVEFVLHLSAKDDLNNVFVSQETLRLKALALNVHYFSMPVLCRFLEECMLFVLCVSNFYLER